MGLIRWGWGGLRRGRGDGGEGDGVYGGEGGGLMGIG